jgi:hypothetical protein
VQIRRWKAIVPIAAVLAAFGFYGVRALPADAEAAQDRAAG